ncbi:MAG: nucleotidyltransferase domain-containing protein [Clostridia bacterium]|nr:nucleotidyltransferase domain-containing protein [Clostridia bacterium]
MNPAVLTPEMVAEILRPVFEQYHVRKAILFGSVAKGTNHENSDVDLLVDSGLKGLQFCGLAGDVEDSLGFDVDIFDIAHIIPDSRIDKEIAATGVCIYETDKPSGHRADAPVLCEQLHSILNNI